ncbi:MAG: UDP-3-O-acyl-N-acetylglucosamine deacetylase, partial [Pseudomonadota bacterium]
MAEMTRTKINKSVQHTLCRSVTFTGKGVHSNLPVTMTLYPADAGTGIVFRRLTSGGYLDISACHSSVSETELCTIIGDPNGIFVATIEHLMAALRSFCVDNVRIEIDGAEAPVMDGSSIEFVKKIKEAGIIPQT